MVRLQCPACGREHPPAVPYTCPACGGNLQVVYDYKKARRAFSRKALAADPERSLWRYAALLPESRPAYRTPLQVGWTPLYRAPRLEASLGLRRVWVKDEGRAASASFKDRASAIVLARALAQGRKVIATASTGNAASSLACLAAGSPARIIIFVPKTAPAAKVAQLLCYGAEVVAVSGTYDQAFDLCAQACDEYGWYNRSTGVNPYTREGKKTGAFELCEQLGWQVPDRVFVSVGDGNIISGLWKGFTELKLLGLISRTPKLMAVQAAGSASIAKALASGGAPKPVSGKTLADSISVSVPRDGAAAVAAVRDSGGEAVVVGDAEILAAIPELAQGAGVFAEPAAAAAYAGLKKAAAARRIRSGETAAVFSTGSGLKDVSAALKAAGKPSLVEPDMKALRRLARARRW